MSVISSRGTLLHYEVFGRGRPVVILGGFFDSAEFWIASMRELSQQYRLYWLDLRAGGEKGRTDPFRFSVETWITHLETFADALGIVRMGMIGHDFGGIVALLFAARQGWQGTQNFQIVAVNVPMSFQNIDPRFLAALQTAEQTRDYLHQVETKPVAKELAFDTGAIQHNVQSLTMLNTYEILSRIQVPVALMFGKEDSIISPPEENRLASLRHVSVNYIPHSRHFPMLDNPSAFPSLLAERLFYPPEGASMSGHPSGRGRPSPDEIPPVIARILTKSGRMVGAGFLVGRNKLVTCARNITSASGSGANQKESEEHLIQVDFPQSDSSRDRINARVLSCDRKSDVAVLELHAAGFPNGPLRLVDQKNLRGDSFRTFGFSSQYPSGAWSGGVILDQAPTGIIQIEGEQIGHRLQAGFHGSPVWDEDLGSVVGMVGAGSTKAQHRAAYIIPASVMAESWPGFSLHRPKPTMLLKKAAKVFLCHASADKPAARELYHRLTGDGFHPWLDEKSLLPGQEWQNEIPRAISGSDAIVIILSKRSIAKSGFVQKEIKYALDINDEKPEGRIFIIPFRLEDCEVPERLRKFHWVDFFDEKGYERLVRALEICADYEE